MNCDGLRRSYRAIARRRILLKSKCILDAKGDKPSDAWDTSNQAYLSYSNGAALTHLPGKPGWDITKTLDDGKISTNQDGAVLSSKVNMLEKVLSPVAVSLLSDFRLRPRWERIYLTCEVLQAVSEKEMIYHVICGVVAGHEPRDFVLLVSQREPCQPQEPYTVTVRSVTHRAVPPRPGFSRSEVLCAGIVTTQASPYLYLAT